MIKSLKTKIFLKVSFLILFISSSALTLSPEYQKKLRFGCYTNSKQYLSPIQAKEYCLCTIEMLNIKFDDEQIDIIFTKKPEEIMTITQFATDHCEKNIKAIK
jgi:hypothetical protein